MLTTPSQPGKRSVGSSDLFRWGVCLWLCLLLLCGTSLWFSQSPSGVAWLGFGTAKGQTVVAIGWTGNAN